MYIYIHFIKYAHNSYYVVNILYFDYIYFSRVVETKEPL